MDELTKAVYEIVRLIPEGRATSYGAIARAIGRPNHSRMVGRIMSGAGEEVPAHRVVNSQGVLSACCSFRRMAQERLEAEGVAVRNHRIVGWKNVFWDPLEEL